MLLILLINIDMHVCLREAPAYAYIYRVRIWHMHSFNEFHSLVSSCCYMSNNRIPPFLMRRRRRLITWQLARLFSLPPPGPAPRSAAEYIDDGE